MTTEDTTTPSDSSTMRAWLYTSASGGLERALTLSPDAPLPTPPSAALASDELLVRVHAASLNPADYKVPELGLISRLMISVPATPGLDFAGVVARAGTGASATFKPGDRVFGRVEMPTRFGTLGEYVTARVAGCAAVPESSELGLEAYSGVGTAGLTAYQCVAPYVRAGAGDRVFVNGGSGGTGTYGIQVAKALGCHVVASCSGSNAELCRSLGADEVIDYTQEDVSAALTRSAEKDGLFRVVVDNVGTSPPDLYKAADRFLGPEGTFVQVGGETSLSSMRATVSRALLPSFLGGGSRKWQFIVTKVVHEDLAQLGQWMSEGKVKPVIDSVFEFEDVPKAFEKLKTKRAKGKIVVRVSDK